MASPTRSGGGTLGAWLQASRPLAQANLAGPLLLGQALAYRITGRFDLRVLVLVALWGVLDQLFILWANDVADRAHDGAERTLFSGGSGVLVEGKLSPDALRRGALAAYGLLGGLSFALALGRSAWLVPLWLAAGALVHGYSYPPLRLSYRGHGEHLQALGVGVVLPLVGYAAQAGELASLPKGFLLATYLLGWAGNVATALPDHAADVRADKRTWPVRFGSQPAGRYGLVLTALAAGVVVLATGVPAFALALVPLLPAALLDPAERRHALAYVVLQGLATQALVLGWAGWLALA
ncbi:MAG: prenyltransferase [Myxococcota bacterium]